MAIHIIIRLLIFIIGFPFSSMVTFIIIELILTRRRTGVIEGGISRCGNGAIEACILGFMIGFSLYIVFLFTEAYFLNKKRINNKRNFNLITAIVLLLLIGVPSIL